MSNAIRLSHLIAALACAAVVAGPASAQRRLPELRAQPTITTPQFRVEAVHFRAVDESGADWPGSDEVYFVFSAGAPTDKITAVYEDLDSGETRNVAARDSCIAPAAACATSGADLVQIEVAMFERDLCGFMYGDLPNAHYVLQHGLCAGDDLIGRATISYTAQQLVSRLRRPGASLERTVTLGGPCGYTPPGGYCTYSDAMPTGPEYTLRYRVTRLDDHVIGPNSVATR
ncbi:MAG: hypothetical protein AB7H66_11665 [Hyphomonadaceae bacterium]